MRTSPLGRDEAVWMIRDMGWIPNDFPNSGATALMRSRFGEAIAAFSLQEAVRETSALRDTETPPKMELTLRANPNEDIAAEVGVDPGANPIEAGIDEVEVKSQSSTELIDSDAEAKEIETVEIRMLPRAAPSSSFLQQTHLVWIAAVKSPPEAHVVWTLRGSQRIKGEGLVPA